MAMLTSVIFSSKVSQDAPQFRQVLILGRVIPVLDGQVGQGCQGLQVSVLSDMLVGIIGLG